MKHGFTLIELMIVVVIIGILAAIAIPNFISMQERSKEAIVKTNMHTLQLTAEDFMVRNDGDYATNGTSTVINTTPAISFSQMIPASLKNPFGGSAYVFQTTAASVKGEVAYEGATSGYTITGFGSLNAITYTLRPGR